MERTNYHSREASDIEQLERSLVKLFQKAFEIDIKTCSESEWSDRISSKGGDLIQWKALINSERQQSTRGSKTS